MTSTRIGYVAPTLDLPDGSKVTSPASAAGLRVGDVIRRVDGASVRSWGDIQNSLVLGSGRSAGGDPQVVIDLEREGRPLQVRVTPRLAGDERVRRVGIGPGFELIVQAVAAGTPAEKAGFRAGDELLNLDGAPMINEIGRAHV